MLSARGSTPLRKPEPTYIDRQKIPEDTNGADEHGPRAVPHDSSLKSGAEYQASRPPKFALTNTKPSGSQRGPPPGNDR